MSNKPSEVDLERVVTVGSATGVRNNSTTGSSMVNGSAPYNQGLDEKKVSRRGPGRRRAETDSSQEDEDGALKTMGKIYSKIKNFSTLTRYFLYVLPLGIVIAIPIVIGAIAARHATIGGVEMLWFFTWIEIVWLGLWVAKVFAHFLPSIFQFLIGVVSTGVRKYSLVLKALEIPISLVLWTVISMVTIIPVTDLGTPKGAAQWRYTVRQVFSAGLVSFLILLGERLIIQLLSITYHRKQFAGKIVENKHNIFLLGLLYEASTSLFPAYCNEFVEEDHIINDSLNLSSLTKGKASGSATPFKFIQNAGRVGDNIASVFGNVAQEVTGKRVFDANSAHSIVVEALERKSACEALAKRLWMSFVVEGRDALFEEDIVEVLGPDRRQEAIECFGVFDRDSNGDVSLEEAITTITEIARERLSLANSMHDVDQAINALDALLSTVVFIITVFVFISFFNSSFNKTLATAGTALLSLSFVFAVTTQEILGSCIFLFVKHPYDIGDRVDLSNGNDQLVVEHISLLYTVFKRVNTGKMVQIPNIVLNTLWIENISRSKAMRERLSIYCAYDTSFEDIQTLKDEMTKFVSAKENNRDYLPEIDIDIVSFDKMTQMELQIEIRHKSNWANESVRAMRRSKFMCALVLALRRVPIYGPGGGDPPMGNANNPSYSVSIPAEVAQSNKEGWAAAKDAKRLYPTKPSSAVSSATDLSGMTANEVVASQQLNARQPSRDVRDDVWSTRDEGSLSTERTVSVDRERQSLEEVRVALRRGSTRGRRHPGGGMHPIEEPSAYPAPLAMPQSRSQYAPIPAASPSVVSPGSGAVNPAIINLSSSEATYSPTGAPQIRYIPGNAFSSHPPSPSQPISPMTKRPARGSSFSSQEMPPPTGPLPKVPQFPQLPSQKRS